MSGLFGTFNIVKRGMFAQQTSLHVVGHNVANANTEGYSVQRANLKTTEPFGMPSLTTAAEPGQLGTGVEVDSITRSRDIFLDIQIRKENATQSKYQTREQFLSEIESIFMEPSDEGMASCLTKFWDSWHQLASNPESSTARTLVVESGDALATAVKHNYQQLEEMETNAGDLIKNDVFDVAGILNQIRDLNEEIRAVAISNQNPNDLMDRRDLLLDRLSQKFNFEIKPTDYKGIEIIQKDGNNTSILKDTNISYGIAYVNNISYDNTLKKWNIELNLDGDIKNTKTLEITEENVKEYLLEKDPTKQESILDNIKNNTDSNKYLKSSSYLKVVNYKIDSTTKKFTDKSDDLILPKYENGSLNGLQTINKDIYKYKSDLNNMARIIAISTNTIQTNSTDNIKGDNFFNTKAESEIEAANFLEVNKAIKDDPALINTGKEIGGNAGNGERALLMGSLRNTRIDISNIKDRKEFINNVFKKANGNSIDDTELNNINGNTTDISCINLADDSIVKMLGVQSGTTIDAYFKSAVASLGVDNQEAKRMVSNQKTLLAQLNIRKQSVSGVSLDEEITNMIQFSKSYQANARMISVIDQLLDVVVNGLIRR